MLFFKKFINYFLDSYTSNNKFRHSLLSYLKLTFERNIKQNNSYLNLGNVFKSSKWSSLNNQNIKAQFFKEFILLLVFIAGLLLAGEGDIKEGLMCVYYDHMIPLYLLFTDVISWTYGFCCFFLLPIFFPKSLITIEANKNSNFKKKHTIKKKNNYVKPDPEIDAALFGNLYKTNSALFNTDGLNVKSTDSSYTNNFFYANLNYKYSLGLSYKQGNLSSDIISKMSLNDLNKLGNNINFINLTGNFNSNLNLMKNDRWLLKNSLLGDELILNTKKYSQAKQLLGDNLNSSLLSNNNVWASTNLSSFNEFLKNKNIDFVSNNNLLLKSLDYTTELNYNYFEESRLFLFKKYYFSNQTRFNNLVFSDLFLNNNTKNYTTIKSEDLFNLYLSLNNLSMNHNLQNLYLSANINSSLSNNLEILNIDSILSTNSSLNLLNHNNLLFINNLFLNNKNSIYFYFN